jgi:hypothetical protein
MKFSQKRGAIFFTNGKKCKDEKSGKPRFSTAKRENMGRKPTQNQGFSHNSQSFPQVEKKTPVENFF